MYRATTERPLSFGVKPTPMHTTYEDVLAVWRAADEVPAIEHAWVWDHMLPLAGDPGGPVLEAWTLLAALAAQTRRLRLGVMVTALPLRPPTVLAKMAATVDVVSGGRLVLGLGAGATRPARPPDPERQAVAEREYLAYGLPLAPPAEGIARLDEACTIISRMWAEDVFDFAGPYHRLAGARCEPKPVQRPGPPLLLGGWGDRMLEVVARHADIWNAPGPPWLDHDELRARNARLDRHCEAIGRDPGEIVRSVQVLAPPDGVSQTRDTLLRLVDAGTTHLVIGLMPPHRADQVAWATDELIAPVLDRA